MTADYRMQDYHHNTFCHHFCLSAMAIKNVTFWSASHIAENSVNFLPNSPFQDYAITHT